MLGVLGVGCSYDADADKEQAEMMLRQRIGHDSEPAQELLH